MARSLRPLMGETRNFNFNWDFTGSPTIASFIMSEAFVRGIMGPIGSGKSTACCVEILRQALTIDPGKDGVRRSRFCAIRGTYRELMDTTLQTWLQVFPEDVFGAFNKNEMVHHIDLGNIKFDMLFRALDKPDDVKKLLSLELTGAWINEAKEIDYSVLKMLEGRVGRYPSKGNVRNYRSFIILDTNPPDTEHWWYRLAEEFAPRVAELRRKEFKTPVDALTEVMQLTGGLFSFGHVSDEEATAMFDQMTSKYEFFKQPSGLSRNAENLANLDPSYYYRAAMGKDPEWVNVFVNGNYGVIFDGRAIYPEYNDSVHYRDSLLGPDEGNRVILRGWDGGRTPAVEFMQMTPRGHVMAFDELTSEDIGLSEFADVVNRHCAANYPGYRFVDYGDPSIFFKSQLEDRSPAIILRAKGIELQAGLQSPTIRKESVKKVLREMNEGRPTFQIGPKCVKLRKGLMGGYCYKRKQVSGEHYQDKPDKNEFSHPVEAFEYVCTRLFGHSIIDNEFDYQEQDEELWETKMSGSDSMGMNMGNPVTGY